MRKSMKKILALVSSAAIAATMITVPIAAKAAVGDTWKYDFGATAEAGWTQVTSEDAYTDAKGYGFLGQEGAYINAAVVDGFTQTAANKTNIKDGGSGALTDYVYTDDVNMPIRFAQKVTPNTYYKVKVTMGNSDKNSKIYLTSERRHFVLMEEDISAGAQLVKTFTVAVHDVHWKDSNNGRKETAYTDDMINVCIWGENPTLCSIEIEQIEKPKVAWIFGDSTVTDGGSGVPWFGYNTYAGWGISFAKYLPDDIAVVNLGEGGLNTSSTSYFDVGKNDITAGDIVVFQMGHNDNGYVRPDYYYNAANEKGATFVYCSPIERLNQYSTADLNKSAKAYAEEKNTPFISLFDVTTKIYTDLGTNGRWYTHSVMWTGTPTKLGTERDATHLNDFGASMTTKGLFEEMAKLAATYPALAPYVTVQADIPAMEPDPWIMRNGKDSGEYVYPPNDLYPLPEASIDYDNLVDITSVDIKDGYLKSITTVRHSDLTYITVFGSAYNADGSLAGVISKRLEPMSAKTIEIVDLTTNQEGEKVSNGLAIPDGGSYKTFVWGGAFSDGSMTMTPYSTVFSGYDIASAVATTGEADVKALETPVTSGKVMVQFTYTLTGDNGVIALSPKADGSDAISLNLTGSTGAAALTGYEDAVIDGLNKGVTRDITLIYDIDYGILTINVDGVGIVDKEIQGALSIWGINPAQIASVNITNADVENLTVSTLNTKELPTQTITTGYYGGGTAEMGTIEAPATATKNEQITLKATPAGMVDGHNYVFGGWYMGDEVLSKDAEIKLYAIEDLDIKAYFYEQTGVEGVADYAITTDAESNVIKVPEENLNITLDITDIIDENGNPVAEFDHASNVAWTVKTAQEGVSISGSTLTISSAAPIDKEEMVSVVITATCNNVSKDYTIIVHNCTNIVYNEDFQSMTAGASADWAEDTNTTRYVPTYQADGDNIYLNFAAENNNGTVRYKNLTENALSGIVQVKADIQFAQPTGNEPTRVARIGFRDSNRNYAVAISRYQSQNDYWINGDKLETNPGNDGWATITAVMNYTTKKADIKLTSLDGSTVYYDKMDVPFFSDAAANFRNIAFETNRYNASAKFDNILINQIAAQTETITATPDSVQIAGTSATGSFEVTLPEGWKVAAVESENESVVTGVVDTNGTTINLTPHAEGDTTVKVTATSSDNKYIKSSVTVPVSVKAGDNANLSSLSVKNGASELISGFDMATTEYTAKTTADATTLDIAVTTDHTEATAEISYNGETVESSDGSAEVTLVDDANEITITVTAVDGATTKTYTVTVDASYVVAENFEADAGKWGFSGNGGTAWSANGYMNLLSGSKASGTQTDTKTFDTAVSDMKSIHLTFDWQSLVESGKGRHSNIEFLDPNGNLIFLLRGNGSEGLLWWAKDRTEADAGYTKFAGFSNNWYSFDLTIDFETHEMTGTISDNTGAKVADMNTAIKEEATGLGKINAYNTYSLAAMGLDNFYLKAAE